MRLLVLAACVTICLMVDPVFAGGKKKSKSKKASKKEKAEGLDSDFCNGKADGMYPNPDDCAKFYSCKKSRTVFHTCGKGSVYSVEKKVCDWSYKVDCGSRSKEPTKSMSKKQKRKEDQYFCQERADGYYPNESDCSKYYGCKKRKTVFYTCGDGSLYNMQSKKCDFAENVDCGKRERPKTNDKSDSTKTKSKTEKKKKDRYFCKKKEDGKYPNEEDCSKYYSCKKGRTTILTCEQDFLYDLKIGKCELAQKVQCGKRGKQKDSNFVIDQGSEEKRQSPTKSKLKTKDKEDRYFCKKKEDGKYPNEEDCSKYYSCKKGRTTILTCEQDFLYDLKTGKCKLARQVDCENRGKQKVDDCDGKVEVIKCESKDFKPQKCDFDGKIKSAKLVQKISKSACEEGSSWDFTDNKLLLTKGCRGIFKVCIERDDDCDGKVETIKCESKDFKPQKCDFDGKIKSAKLVQKISKSACKEGTSWDFTDNKLLLTKGCRGIFKVCIESGSSCDGTPKTLECKSKNNRPEQCKFEGKVLSVNLLEEKSVKKCSKTTWGYRSDYLWTRGGCQATFEVCYEDDAGGKCSSNKDCHKHGFCDKKTRTCFCEKGYSGDGVKSCEKSCICEARGDPHYNTFDGQRYTYQGECTYLFSQRLEAHNTECNYNFTVTNEYRYDRDDVTYTQKGILTMHNTPPVQLGPGKLILVDGMETLIDFSSEFFNITKIQRDFVVMAQCGIIMGFDAESRIFLQIPRAIGEEVRGMCGNCNRRKDDCVDQSGQILHRPGEKCPGAAFGGQWLVGNPYDDPEMCKVEEILIECDEESSEIANSMDYCGSLDFPKFPDSPFASEFRTDPEIAIDTIGALSDCMYDVCAAHQLGERAKEVACEAIENYADRLEQKFQKDIPEWRSEDLCPITCDKITETYASNRTCENRCHSKNIDDCHTPINPGCVCKSGLFRSPREYCVPIEECGCKFQGRNYEEGDVLTMKGCRLQFKCVNGVMKRQPALKGCLKGVAECKKDEGKYQCKCKDGYDGDGVKKCIPTCGSDGRACHPNAVCKRPKGEEPYCVCNEGLSGDGYTCADMCKCQHTGDPHETDFHGNLRHFQGTCHYKMTQIKNPTKCRITVVAKHKPRINKKNKKVSTTERLIITTKKVTVILDQKKKVLVDGLELYGSIDDFDERGITIEDEGIYKMVTTSCGVKIGFDGGTKAVVEMPKHLGMFATGMCGECTEENPGPFMMPDGTYLNPKIPGATVVWGNAWQVHIEDEDYCESWENPHETCDVDSKRKAKFMCKKVVDETDKFKGCIKKLKDEAAKAFQSCIFDVCATEGDEEKQRQLVCDAASAFYEKCLEVGFDFEWRNSKFCPAEKELGCDRNKGLKYSKRFNKRCLNTCQHKRSKWNRKKREKQCKSKNFKDVSEGCVCKNDDLYMENGRCVPIEQCGCAIGKNKYYPLGTKILSSNCREERTCIYKKKNKVSEFKTRRVKGCDKKTERCKKKDGKYQCSCRNGYELIRGKCKESCQGQKCHKDAFCKKNKKCVCKRGFEGNGIDRCEPRARRCECSASGDPHYKKFDDKKPMHFMGICSYVLSQYLQPTEECFYKVIVKNERRHGRIYPSYTRNMLILIEGYEVLLGQDQVVKVKEGSLPYEEVETPFFTETFKIYNDGKYVIMQTKKCDQLFMFDGKSRAVIDVPAPKNPGDYSAACGNCDKDPDNDWVTSDGDNIIDMPKKKRDIAFMNSWLIPMPDDKLTKKECIEEAQKEKPKCSKQTRQEAADTENCGVIINKKKGPFAKCFSSEVDLSELAYDTYVNCFMDFCATEGDKVEQARVVCSHSDVFASFCKRNGIELDWRSTYFCPMECSPHSHYTSEPLSIGKACHPLQPAIYPEESCICNKGYKRKGKECIPEEECGCYHKEIINGNEDEKYIELSDEYIDSSCDAKQCIVFGGQPALIPKVGNNTCNMDVATCNVTDEGKFKCICKENFKGTTGYDCEKEEVDKPPSVPGPNESLGSPVGPPKPPGPSNGLPSGSGPFAPGPPSRLQGPPQAPQVGPPGQRGKPGQPAGPPGGPPASQPGQQQGPPGKPREPEVVPPTLNVQASAPGVNPPSIKNEGTPTTINNQPEATPTQQEKTTTGPVMPPSEGVQPPNMVPGPPGAPPGGEQPPNMAPPPPGAPPPGAPPPGARAPGLEQPPPGAPPPGVQPNFAPGPPGAPAPSLEQPTPEQTTTTKKVELPAPLEEAPAQTPAQASSKVVSSTGQFQSSTAGPNKAPALSSEEGKGQESQKESEEKPCVEEEPRPTPLQPKKGERVKECIDEDDLFGELYDGTLAQTISGEKCQPWSESKPHNHPWKKRLGSQNNFCRNLRWETDELPKQRPWCYTMNPNIDWQYCQELPLCKGNEDDYKKPESKPLTEEQAGCYNATEEDKGQSYAGEVYFTRHGEICDSWYNNGYPSVPHNQCRNFLIGEKLEMDMPWCLVGGKKKECFVEECSSKPKKDVINACTMTMKMDLCSTEYKLVGDCEQTFEFHKSCSFTVERLTTKKYRLYMMSDDKQVDIKIGRDAASLACGATFHEPSASTLVVRINTCGHCMAAAFKEFLPNPDDPWATESPKFCKK